MNSKYDFVSSKTDSKRFFKVCDCKREFRARSSYYRHKQNCKDATNLGKFLCKEEDCNFKSKFSEDLVNHLRSSHHIDSQEETREFDKYSEFESWKEEYEKETKSAFVRRSVKRSAEDETMYFYCNRSGSYTSVSTGKRITKSQGLGKIGINCPARLLVNVKKDPEHVIVNICHQHYGHDNNLAHIRIPKRDRQMIAQQLAEGMTFSQVLENIFDGSETVLQRKHLSTRRDILNIAKSYGIEKIEKRAEDHLSVDAYVKENENSIFIYKRQGDGMLQCPKDEACLLAKDDFVLGIMTEFQKEMLKKFGNDIICVDATHGTNVYQFNLITMLIVDEYREGIPVAWLICNKENGAVLKLFFKIVKEINNINPAVFMSDNAPQYFSAFKDIFQSSTKKLLCHWHIHKDWQQNLNKIKNKEVATTVYKALCILLEEGNREKFEMLLDECCRQLEENFETEDFYKYFKNEWVPIKEEWAKCFRLKCGINTNMFVESFHKILKYGDDYLKGKQGKRIDKCVSVLLQFSKDLAIERLIKLEKGKNTWMSSEINKCHELALALPLTLVTKASSSTWDVKSAKSLVADTSICNKLIYKVRKEPVCKKNCKITCQECCICLHSYSCTCPDSLTRTNICKHIHLVNYYEKISVSFVAVTEENTDSQDNLLSESALDEELIDQDYIFQSLSPEKSIESLKKKLLEQTMELCRKIQNCDEKSLLLAAKQHINSALCVLD